MAFVNELVTSEDIIEKYQLDDLWNHYNRRSPGLPKSRLSGLFTHFWTIDRDRDIWLMYIATVYSSLPEFSMSGLAEPTRENIFILNWQGVNIEVRLYRLENTSKKYAEQPFYIFWKLLSLTPENLPTVSTTEIIETLKESLSVYGENGAHFQVNNTIVNLSL